LHRALDPEQVPASDMEALKSPLMGLFEKRRARSFFL
jgi:RAB protein geranylgeranyltransferase component A